MNTAKLPTYWRHYPNADELQDAIAAYCSTMHDSIVYPPNATRDQLRLILGYLKDWYGAPVYDRVAAVTEARRKVAAALVVVDTTPARDMAKAIARIIGSTIAQGIDPL
jgi:hypothetical protein